MDERRVPLRIVIVGGGTAGWMAANLDHGRSGDRHIDTGSGITKDSTGVNLTWRNFSLDFSKKTFVMGILNVTPDSFSDGGLYLDTKSAAERALRMVNDGADIIDIGGESTRPGSDPVPIDEELKRTIPVIETLAQKIRVAISIDTYKADVAKKALEAGASMVNDISRLRFQASGMFPAG